MGVSIRNFSYDESDDDRRQRRDGYEWGDAPLPAGMKRRRVQLAQHIWADLPAVYVVPDHEGMQVELLLDQTPAGVRAVAVTVSRDGTPLSGQDLRAVRLGELVDKALGAIVHMVTDGGEALLSSVGDVRMRFADPANQAERAAARDAASKADFLTQVAALYETATVIGAPPQRYVMDAYNAPRSTAGYWIREARKRGLLAPAKPAGEAIT